MNPQEFIREYGQAVIRATRGTGLFPSVKMAQMAIESGWGRSMPGNNAFGIKARGDHTPFWKGAHTEQSTREYIDGEYVTMGEPFRAYNSVADSIRDHTAFLAGYERYWPVFGAQTAQAQAEALGRSGYATAPGYGSSLLKLMERYDLYELDRKAARQRAIRVGILTVAVIIIVVLLWTKRKQIGKTLNPKRT